MYQAILLQKFQQKMTYKNRIYVYMDETYTISYKDFWILSFIDCMCLVFQILYPILERM